ncbi:hypothetical protein TRAPUB_6102 [Trametes pubescens]|uniref:Uncharacterized protein n=1 Tax=Trametes pubescens TaxID=154538 RepID=A0A1M2V6W7_TRAPU|nr:hypothetical protein TRAPUB_6102 [Trametes pubescens]
MDYPLAEAEHQHNVSARFLREWEDYTLDPPLLDLSGQIAEQQWCNWYLWEVSQVCRYADPSIDGNREEDKDRGDGFRQHGGRGLSYLDCDTIPNYSAKHSGCPAAKTHLCVLLPVFHASHAHPTAVGGCQP